MIGVQTGIRFIILLFMGTIVLFCINCSSRKEAIEHITINYLPPVTNVITLVSCDYFDKDFSYLKKEVVLDESSFLNNFEKHLINLDDSDSSYIIDVRIKCLIKRDDQNIDTLCFGEYFGIVYNGILMNNNVSFLDFIKNEIHYYE